MGRFMLTIFCFFNIFLASGQKISILDEENFAFQVKQIDEFIDRFNNADCTLVKNYMREKHGVDQITREDLLKTLFNYTDVRWNLEEVAQFLAEVTEAKDPKYLDFLDDNWYAELDCSGMYKEKRENFKVVLKIQLNEKNQAVKWVIESVFADFLLLPEPVNPSHTLNPASHGTDFMNLNDALLDVSNIRNYVGNDADHSQLLLFLHELCERNLIFSQVDRITYHFLQIDNWVFQVRDYNRNTRNSGWLISDLIHIKETDKKYYKREKLFLL